MIIFRCIFHHSFYFFFILSEYFLSDFIQKPNYHLQISFDCVHQPVSSSSSWSILAINPHHDQPLLPTPMIFKRLNLPLREEAWFTNQNHLDRRRSTMMKVWFTNQNHLDRWRQWFLRCYWQCLLTRQIGLASSLPGAGDVVTSWESDWEEGSEKRFEIAREWRMTLHTREPL